MMLSACAESMIISMLPTKSMILSAPYDRVIRYYHANSTWRGGWQQQKTTIGNTDNCQQTTLVNSASTALPIFLPPKMAKFCHTSNRLLVGHQCRHALSRLYFNSSASSRSVDWSVGQLVGQLVGLSLVGWSTIRVPGLWEVSLQKDNIPQFCLGCTRGRRYLRYDNNQVELSAKSSSLSKQAAQQSVSQKNLKTLYYY
jgi:hypothetical protein